MWPRAASLWSMMSTSSVPTIGRESTAVEEKVVVATAKVAAPQARATLVTPRPAKLRAGPRWRRLAASGCFHHRAPCRSQSSVSGFLRQLVDNAVFDRISFIFIFRVFPSKYASLIGLPFIFCVKIVFFLISAL